MKLNKYIFGQICFLFLMSSCDAVKPTDNITTPAPSSKSNGTSVSKPSNTPDTSSSPSVINSSGNIIPTPVPATFPVAIPPSTVNVIVATLAGSTHGFADGTGYNAQFYYPQGVAVDSYGNVYVADGNNNRIRKITQEGVVSTIAGSTKGFADGTATNAQFNEPHGVTVDSFGNLFVADTNNNRIRKITPEGVVSTIAGSTNGFSDGTATNAKFSSPWGLAIDNYGNVYVVDSSNNKIRKITPEGVVSTLAGSTNGFTDGTGTNAKFNLPRGLALDTSGNIYVADSSRIRKVTSSGVVSTLAGGSTYGFRDGIGTNAQFYYPYGLAVDISGNVYVADSTNDRIRKITPEGVVSTFAGSGIAGYLDGSATNAKFSPPTGVALDISGNIYVADCSNHKIRKITTSN